MPKYPYRDLGVNFDRNFRNALNANFDDIEADIKELGAGAQQALEAAHEAETQAIYARTSGDYAQDKGDYAAQQGDYAKTQGDYAKTQGDAANLAATNANDAANNANSAATNANNAATAANDAATNANTAADNANNAATNANTAADNANTQATNAQNAAQSANDAATNANNAADNANTQAAYAQTQGDYAKAQGDYAKQVGDENKTRWLTAVNTYADIATTYPNPQLGDTVQTIDDSKIYRWNGKRWVWTQQYNANAISDVQNKIGILSKNQIFLTASGSDDTVAIDNAFNTCPDGGTIVFTAGIYTRTAPLVGKSNVNVVGLGKVIIQITCSGEYAVNLRNMTNSVWENITFIRQGQGVAGNNTVLVINGTTDDTVILKDIKAINQMTPASGQKAVSCRGIHIYDSAKPILRNCKGIGGVSTNDTGVPIGISIGAKDNSIASPTLYDCIGIGGTNGASAGIECDNTVAGNEAKLFNCIGYGGTTSDGVGGAGIQIDDIDASKLTGCKGFGGNGTDAAGIRIFSGASPELNNCYGKGGTGVRSYGIQILNGTPVFNHCVAEGGNADSCRGWSTSGNSFPTLNNCSTKLASTPFIAWFPGSTSMSIQPSPNNPFQIRNLDIVVVTPQSGVTINIGSTPGGSDIASGVSIASAGWQSVNLLANARKQFAAGSYIYITASAPIPNNCIQIVGEAVFANNYCYGLGLEGRGIVARNSSFSGNVNSAALNVASYPITRNESKFYNCVFDTRTDETGNLKTAISCASYWDNPDFQRCTINGKLNNINIPQDIVAFQFYLDAVTANLSNQKLKFSGSAWQQIPMLRNGCIEGYSVNLSAAPTSGSITVTVGSNGNPLTGVPSSTLTTTSTKFNNIPKGTPGTTFVSGNSLYVTVSTTSDFAPSGSLNLIVTLYVRLSNY
ncbi:hypothetical protein [Geobacillus stearothermophilus]|uniref:hypothetical protein n=1 Tax=Geobacillus stearothermophilus TaxID=1422 RepID=UPI003D20802A